MFTNNANHRTKLIETKDLETIPFYSTENLVTLQDFWRMSGYKWINSPKSNWGRKISFEQTAFQTVCTVNANKHILNLTEASWAMNSSGIFCIDTGVKARFTVQSPNGSEAICNALEAGLFITLQSINQMIKLEETVRFGDFLRFYHNYLKELLLQLSECDVTAINVQKLNKLLN